MINIENAIERGIVIEGVEARFNKVSVPLDNLILNPGNGRIAKEKMHWENVNKRELKNDGEDEPEISKLLLEKLSNDEADKLLISDILNDGVKGSIFVDINGTILDGNRRIALIKKGLAQEVETGTKIGIGFARFTNLSVLVVPAMYSDDETKITAIATDIKNSVKDSLPYDQLNSFLKIERLYETAPVETHDERLDYVVSKLAGDVTLKEVTRDIEIYDEMKIFLKDYLGKPMEFALIQNKLDFFSRLRTFTVNWILEKVITDLEFNDENFKRIRKVLWPLLSLTANVHKFGEYIPSDKATLKTPLNKNEALTKIEKALLENEVDKFVMNNINTENPDLLAKISSVFKEVKLEIHDEDPSAVIVSSVGRIVKNTNDFVKWVDSVNLSDIAKMTTLDSIISELSEVIENLKSSHKTISDMNNSAKKNLG